VLDQFSDLGEYYPGSRERRQTVPAPRPLAFEDFLGDGLGEGVWLPLRGEDVEFFTIGQLARAINRKAVTLRAWESAGVIPTSGYSTKADDPRGRRRLYTRAQCLGIIRLAKEHNIMEAGARRPLDAFGQAVRELFSELKGR
jgi:hypothetical protein